jgi:hypothetical protein
MEVFRILVEEVGELLFEFEELSFFFLDLVEQL